MTDARNSTLGDTFKRNEKFPVEKKNHIFLCPEGCMLHDGNACRHYFRAKNTKLTLFVQAKRNESIFVFTVINVVNMLELIVKIRL